MIKNFMIKLVGFAFILCTTIASCGQKDPNVAFQNYMREIQGTKEYVEIKEKLKDSVQSWIDRELGA
jgi:hypothetical protein